jgi:hypothetical protein
MAEHDIWKEFWEIQKARQQKLDAAMGEYDREVHYPAIKALQERCLEQHGQHARGKLHSNGLGWTWWYCSRCGASFDKEGPE